MRAASCTGVARYVTVDYWINYLAPHCMAHMHVEDNDSSITGRLSALREGSAESVYASVRKLMQGFRSALSVYSPSFPRV
jgi:hypothetical protein